MEKRDLAGIGKQLKEFYEELRVSPLPDRLAALTEQLDARFLELNRAGDADPDASAGQETGQTE